MDPENYQLTRNDFELCAKNAFKNLLAEQDFSDVTLACSNNKQVKAHKVILGACSPFFKEILLKNPHQHPLIYLKGIGIDDLEAIIKFIYQGQTSISETNLDSFLASAQELQVEGLLLAKNEAAQKSVEKKQQSEQRSEMPEFVESIDQPEELETIANYLKNSKVLPSNPIQNKVMPISNTNSTSVNKFKCDVCDFESLYRKSLKRHKENVHQIQTVVQPNEFFESMDTSEQLLAEVNKSAEKIVSDISTAPIISDKSKEISANASQNIDLFKCDMCDFSSKHKWSIKRHVDRVHVEATQKNLDESMNKSVIIESPSKEDSLVSDTSLHSEDSFSSSLNEPLPTKPSSYYDQSSHEEDQPVVNVPEDSKHHCDHCEFATTHKKNLKRHVLRLHGNIDDEDTKISDNVAASSEPKYEKLVESPVKTPEPASGSASSSKSFIYTCDKCDFTSDNKWNLTRHILRVHKEMKYPCDYCDYKAPQTYRLKEHMQKKHR